MTEPAPAEAEPQALATNSATSSDGRAGFGRSVLSVMRGSVFGQVVAIAATPLLSRVFTPSAFGDFALVVSVAVTISALAGLRYETAIPLCQSDDEAANAFAVAMSAVIAVVVLSGIATVALQWDHALFASARELRPWLMAVPLLVLVAGCGQVLSFVAVRNEQFQSLSWFRVNLTLPVALLQLAFGLAISRGAGSLISASILGQVFACSVLAYTLFSGATALPVRRASPADMRRVIVKYKNFPLYMTPYGLVSMGRDRLVYIILGVYVSSSVVGIYSLAYRLTLVPINLIATALSPVVFQRASAVADIREIEGLIADLLRWLGRLSAPGFVLLAIAAHRLAGAILGQSWADVGEYAAILAVPAWLMLQTTWLDRLMDRLNRQRLALTIEIAYTAVALLGVAISLHYSSSGLVAIGVFAAITALYNVVWMLALYRVARFSMRALLRTAAESSGFAVAAVAIVEALFSSLPGFVALVAGLALYGLHAVACLRGMRARALL